MRRVQSCHKGQAQARLADRGEDSAESDVGIVRVREVGSEKTPSRRGARPCADIGAKRGAVLWKIVVGFETVSLGEGSRDEEEAADEEEGWG